jgi:WD40 repeat protein
MNQNAHVKSFGGVWDARFLGGEEWFESTGDTSGVRLGRIDRSGRLAAAISLDSDEAIATFAAKDENHLSLLSSYRPFHRLLLGNLHLRERQPPPPDDASFDMDPDRRMLIEAREDGTIQSWDLIDATPQPVVYRGLEGSITSLKVDSRFGVIAAVNGRNQLAVWRIGEPSSPKLIADLAKVLVNAQPLDPSTATPNAADGSDFSPSLQFVSSGRWLSFDFKYLLDLDAIVGPLAWRLPEGAHETKLLGCCVMQLFDAKYNLWSLDGNSDRPTRLSSRADISAITAYDYSVAQRRLALGQMNGRIVVIDFDSSGVASETVNVASHDFAIRSLALNSDARMVAAGSRGEVTLTRLADDKTVASHVRLKIHGGDVRVLRFSPNDKWLLSGGEDEAVHVHPLNPNLLLEIACSVAGRPMSDTEVERVGPQAAAGVCRPRTGKNPGD